MNEMQSFISAARPQRGRQHAGRWQFALLLTLATTAVQAQRPNVPGCPIYPEDVEFIPSAPREGEVVWVRWKVYFAITSGMAGTIDGHTIAMNGVMNSTNTLVPPTSYAHWNAGELKAGTYSVSLSAMWINGQIPAPFCPDVVTTLVVAGAPPAPVPAPLFAWPALALLAGLIALLAGWRVRGRLDA